MIGASGRWVRRMSFRRQQLLFVSTVVALALTIIILERLLGVQLDRGQATLTAARRSQRRIQSAAVAGVVVVTVLLVGVSLLFTRSVSRPLEQVVRQAHALAGEALATLLQAAALGRPRIITAATGGEAATTAADHPIDIAFLDIRMPGMSGLDVATRILRSSPQAAVVFVSAYDYFEYAHRAMRLGARDYRIKPIEDDAVLRIVRSWWNERFSARPDAPETTPRFVPPAATAPADPGRRGLRGVPSTGARFGEVARFIEQQLLRDLLAGTLSSRTLLRGMQLIGHGDEQIQAIVVRPVHHRSHRPFGPRGQVGSALDDAVRRFLERGYGTPRVLRHVGRTLGVALVIGDCATVDSSARSPQRAGEIEIRESGTEAITPATRDHERVPELVATASARLFDYAREPGTRDLRRRIIEAVSAADADRVIDLAGQFWHVIPRPHDRPAEARALIALVEGTIELRGQQPTARYHSAEPPVADATGLGTRLVALLPQTPPLDPRGQAIVAWIDRNFARRVGLADLARSIDVSESHCSRECSALLGASFSHLLRERRIREAKRLLRSTTLHVGQIAMQTGFRDGQYLARVFREVTGIPPGEWRRRYTV